MKKKKQNFLYEFLAFCIACGGIAYTYVQKDTRNVDEIQVYFIDVGQGDSSLVVHGDDAVLIDGGLPSQSNKIYAFLKDKNIKHLKYVVASHMHNDHTGGLSGALESGICESVLVPDTNDENGFLQQVEEKNIPVVVTKENDVYTLDDITFQILGPTDLVADNENNNSLVVRMEYHNVSFLFTGDAEQEEEQLLMYNHYDALDVDVLKASHHGSSNAASSAWMQAVSPKYTVISCGKDNVYGHPHDEALRLIKQSGSVLYRTDLQGTITCTTDGENIQFSTEKNSETSVWNARENIVAEKYYILDIASKKFHRPDCSNAEDIASYNRETSDKDRDTLLQEGYSPCGKCQP